MVDKKMYKYVIIRINIVFIEQNFKTNSFKILYVIYVMYKQNKYHKRNLHNLIIYSHKTTEILYTFIC